MNRLVVDAVYEIELCSGELRRWTYLGGDQRGGVWWRDTESRLEFNESSLMYAWRVVGKVADGAGR